MQAFMIWKNYFANPESQASISANEPLVQQVMAQLSADDVKILTEAQSRGVLVPSYRNVVQGQSTFAVDPAVASVIATLHPETRSALADEGDCPPGDNPDCPPMGPPPSA